jgi:hypothetical protein
MTKPVEIWIDALEFEERGGWKPDTQFVRLMGSGYLMAADGAGVPVADATIQVTVPESANYRIWVRDRNWLRHHSPGKFKLVVDGTETFNTLGAMPSDSWIWEIAGDFRLEAGEHTVALHDLTGYFARCASIGQATANLPAATAFPLLREAGLAAEEAMFAATDGVNTHKGAIYTMGILCAAMARLWHKGETRPSTDTVLSLCAEIAGAAAEVDLVQGAAETAGMRLYRELGIRGIRGEMAAH